MVIGYCSVVVIIYQMIMSSQVCLGMIIRTIARVLSYAGPIESENNAKIIAAAPTLLKEQDELRKKLCETSNGHMTHCLKRFIISLKKGNQRCIDV